MSVLTKKGTEAFENQTGGGRSVGDKVEFLRLKSGQSARVAFLHDPDDDKIIASAEFYAHSDFQAKIYSHPCIAVQEKCPSCEAGIKRMKRKLIAFLDLEDGKRKVFECSPKQYDGIKTAIADFLEDGSVFELAFKLAKSGTGTSTTVTVTPILKPTAADKEALKTVEEPITEDFFDRALGNPTADYIRQKIAGYTPTPAEPKDDNPTSVF
jgi:hypothetical protein